MEHEYLHGRAFVKKVKGKFQKQRDEILKLPFDPKKYPELRYLI